MRQRDSGVSRVSTVLLWLLVINLGVALGAGLYESRITVPDWIDTSGPVPEWNPEAARADDTGRRFWVGVTTVPLTLLAVANLFAGWRAPRAVRRWWIGAAATAIADRAFTLGYFVPAMIGLMRRPNSGEAVADALRWAQLNHVRHIIVFAALLASLRAFSLLYSLEGSRSAAGGDRVMPGGEAGSGRS